MSEERLQKILSAAGLCSRREAEEWIEEGRVLVNGARASLGQKADLARDAIRVDGKMMKARDSARRYVLLNKPKGCITTTTDPEGRPTVLELIPPALRKGLKPVGRLDFGSEGLLILTDDGDFAQAVSHPSRGLAKNYRVKVWGEPTERDLERLRRGIVIDGRKTRPCEIETHHTTTGKRPQEGNSWLTVILHEGRSRQIRKMFERIGHPVSKLRRVAIGPVRDEKLRVGAYRALTPEEIRKLASGEKAPARRG
ncbi:MAG: pseudouridine synthase [Thermoanaerobaculia bacterium]